MGSTEDKNGSPDRLVWYLNGEAVMKADIPAGTRKMSDFTILINVAMGGNVTHSTTPVDGVYDLVVHSLEMHDAAWWISTAVCARECISKVGEGVGCDEYNPEARQLPPNKSGERSKVGA